MNYILVTKEYLASMAPELRPVISQHLRQLMQICEKLGHQLYHDKDKGMCKLACGEVETTFWADTLFLPMVCQITNYLAETKGIEPVPLSEEPQLPALSSPSSPSEETGGRTEAMTTEVIETIRNGNFSRMKGDDGTGGVNDLAAQEPEILVQPEEKPPRDPDEWLIELKGLAESVNGYLEEHGDTVIYHRSYDLHDDSVFRPGIIRNGRGEFRKADELGQLERVLHDDKALWRHEGW